MASDPGREDGGIARGAGEGGSYLGLASGEKYPRLLTLASLVVIVAALYFAKVVLVPIAIAFLVAFLLSPLVDRLIKLRLPRIPSVLVVMAFALAVVCGLAWVVVIQLNDIVNQLPEYRANLEEKFAILHDWQSRFTRASESVNEIATRGASAAESKPEGAVEVIVAEKPELIDVVEPIVHILNVIGGIGVVFLFVMLMLIKKQEMRDRLIRLSGSHLYLTTRALDEAGAKVSRYIFLTTIINGAHGACLGVALWFLGIPNAVLWGVLAALLRYIPYIGPWIAAGFPIALALAVFHGWTTPLLTIGLILVLELISNNIVEPWLYGTGTGVSPGALLVSAFFWTWLWGAPGLFLAAPLTVCIAVIGKHVPALGFLAVLLSDDAGLPPEAKLYQRLLARDQEGASEILLAELRQKTLIEAYDTTLIPALALAEQDEHKGTLDERTLGFVVHAMRELAEEASDWRPAPAKKEKGADNDVEEPANVAAAPPPPPTQPPVRALCVAADDEADHVVAGVAAHVLRPIGVDADVVALATLKGQLGQIVAEKDIQMVLISDVPPSGFAHVRYICKRLAMNAPEMPIIVGVWGSTLDVAKARERLPEYTTLHCVKSLAEAVEVAQRLIEGLRLRSRATEAAPPRDDAAAKRTGRPTHARPTDA